MNKKCFMILGMHRSGTSATTGLLSHFDISLGTALINPNEENPKGFFENTAILNLNKKILSAANSDWDDYHFNINDIDSEQVNAWAIEAYKVLTQEFSDNNSFAIKDPRLCLLFPIWEKALMRFDAEINIIIVNRNPNEVSASLKTRNDFRNQKSLLLWAQYTLSLEFFSRGYERLLIQYPTDFIASAELIKKFKKFTKLNITDKKTNKALIFYEKELTRHQTEQQVLKDTPPLLRHLSSLINTGDLSNNSAFDSIKKEYQMMLSFFSDKETIEEKNQLISRKSTQIRQRNERITRLYADIEEIEISISHRIEANDKQVTSLKQKLSKTTAEAIQFSNRTSNLAKRYLHDRESNASLKGFFKHKKDKRLIQKINRLQHRLQNKLIEINPPDQDIEEQL